MEGIILSLQARKVLNNFPGWSFLPRLIFNEWVNYKLAFLLWLHIYIQKTLPRKWSYSTKFISSQLMIVGDHLKEVTLSLNCLIFTNCISKATLLGMVLPLTRTSALVWIWSRTFAIFNDVENSSGYLGTKTNNLVIETKYWFSSFMTLFRCKTFSSCKWLFLFFSV